MHELSLCKNIIDIVNQHIAGKKYIHIIKIYLEVGELIAIEESALIFSFQVLAKDTIAHDARLEIITIPGKAMCDSCQQIAKINQYSDSCQFCQSFSLTIIQGEELRIQSMEVE